MRTRPELTMWSASLGSPRWKITSWRRQDWGRQTAVTAARFSRGIPAKKGTP